MAYGNSPLGKIWKKAKHYKNSKNTIEKPKHCLEIDKNLELSPDEFPKDGDSTIFLRDRTRNSKLESHFKRKRSTIAKETAHTITMETPRGRQVYAKRDVSKTTKQEGTSHSPQQKQKGCKYPLYWKIAAFKDAITRSEMELSKPLKMLAAGDYRKKAQQKEELPRKQKNQRKSLTKRPEKQTTTIDNSESSSEEEIVQNKTLNKMMNQSKKLKVPFHDRANGQRNNLTGSGKTLLCKHRRGGRRPRSGSWTS